MSKDAQESKNVAAKIAACIAACIVACLEDLVEYISTQAYAYIAVSGQPFFESSWSSFLLNLKHCLKFIFAN